MYNSFSWSLRLWEETNTHHGTTEEVTPLVHYGAIAGLGHTHAACHLSRKPHRIYFVKSTQYKKLAPNALWFTYQDLKSCKSHAKNETKNIKLLVFNFSPILLLGFVPFFHGVCKISNLNMWTTKHLAQASCTELTLKTSLLKFSFPIGWRSVISKCLFGVSNSPKKRTSAELKNKNKLLFRN